MDAILVMPPKLVIINKTCPQCGREFQCGGRGRRHKGATYCMNSCAWLARWKKRGTRTEEATTIPTAQDIAWAAGLFEGEGTAKHGMAVVYQCDRWVLDRMLSLFGGVVELVNRSNKSLHHRPSYIWRAQGPRGRGFLFTVYKFLSPGRKTQALAAMSWRGLVRTSTDARVVNSLTADRRIA